ncbi:MAG: AmmeMemoRadiSam system protein B [Spirochaetaceae bacterium]|nr:AmmeMemoRadiSam system protein B [Spirochaetaceae bacterium]
MNSPTMVRKPELPSGWYPSTSEEISKFLGACANQSDGRLESAIATISPHAGWYFSGRISAESILSLAKADTVVVIGGHLSHDSPILYAPEPGFQTQAGDAEADEPLLKALFNELRDSGIPAPQPDRYIDNSVEVLLPMIVSLQPKARIIWLRSPPSYMAKELGAALGRVATSLDRKVVCVGSTDLTHYGPSYGFEPAGYGEAARKWVREVNDKAFVDALLAMDCEAALALAVKKGSACSPGAAVAAIGFALEQGASQSQLNGYDTSLSVRDDDSFVGYASVSYF